MVYPTVEVLKLKLDFEREERRLAHEEPQSPRVYSYYLHDIKLNVCLFYSPYDII